VGHNGAGKTTAVDVVTGLVRPDAGTVRVAGTDALAAPRRASALTGVAAQDLQLYGTATVRQNIALCADLAGVGRGAGRTETWSGRRRTRARAAVADVMDELGLAEVADRPVGLLSGGQRRRVQAACALVGRAAVLLLDEPTVGADPQTRSALLTAVRRRAEDGAAVLYTTHYLPELVELGATVAVARAGRVVARGSQAELLAQLPARVIVALEDSAFDLAPEQLCLGDESVERMGAAWVIRTADPGETLARLVRAGHRPRSIEVEHASLDELFASLREEVCHVA
jgi:ABC-2 type transport system ATP-binding protein